MSRVLVKHITRHGYEVGLATAIDRQACDEHRITLDNASMVSVGADRLDAPSKWA